MTKKNLHLMSVRTSLVHLKNGCSSISVHSRPPPPELGKVIRRFCHSIRSEQGDDSTSSPRLGSCPGLGSLPTIGWQTCQFSRWTQLRHLQAWMCSQQQPWAHQPQLQHPLYHWWPQTSKQQQAQKAEERCISTLQAHLTLPQQTVKRILDLEFLEMLELTAGIDPPQAGNCPPFQPQITNISMWLERFSLMAATLVTRFPEKAPELFAYQVLMVRAERNYEPGRWILFDCQFRREALTRHYLNLNL